MLLIQNILNKKADCKKKKFFDSYNLLLIKLFLKHFFISCISLRIVLLKNKLQFSIHFLFIQVIKIYFKSDFQ